MRLLTLLGKTPVIHPSCFVAPDATLIGDIVMGRNSSIWFRCVLRADVQPVRIGERTNIQDGSIVHGTKEGGGRKGAATSIGSEVTVGHGVILHGCQIADRCLIGMGSIIMDGAKIESDVIVGAGSLVVEGQHIPSGHLALGRPAKVLRPLSAEELQFLKISAQNYIDYSSWYQDLK